MLENMHTNTLSGGSWWKDAVFYQVYPRSFRDSDGDGIGDLRGVTAGLDYLKELGVDALWLSPFYPSPQVDAGYDVSDYTAVDPLFGTLDDFDELLKAAHGKGLRAIIDVVPNHSSDQHPFFQAALAANPGSPERAMYHFVDGRGEDGEQPPSNWISAFGGSSWTRVTEADGRPGQWYYHLFAAEQPDFNWENPLVLEFFEGVLRFWLDRGVDGFRIDVSDALIKDTSWPDTPNGWAVIPKDDSSGVHQIYRQFRCVLEEYPGSIAVIETGADEETVALFLRHDEMQQAFNFRFLKTPWDASALAQAIAESERAFSAVGAPTTWVIENHDTTRAVTRYATANRWEGDYVPHDNGTSSLLDANLHTGWLRARAMAVLLLTLPGSAYLYAGQELGLPEVTDLPDEVLQDPMFFRTNGESRGRDGCRVPLPWTGERPPFGFSPDDAAPTWLPQPDAWAGLTVEKQLQDAASMLTFYRELLELRRSHPALGGGRLVSISSGADQVIRVVLSADIETSAEVVVIINFSPQPVELPAGEVLIASASLANGSLPAECAAVVQLA